MNNKYKSLCNILVWRYLLYIPLFILFVILLFDGMKPLETTEAQGYGWMFVMAIWTAIFWVPILITQIITNIKAVKTMNNYYKQTGLIVLNKRQWITHTVCSCIMSFINLSILMCIGLTVILDIYCILIVILGFVISILNIIIATKKNQPLPQPPMQYYQQGNYYNGY